MHLKYIYSIAVAIATDTAMLSKTDFYIYPGKQCMDVGVESFSASLFKNLISSIVNILWFVSNVYWFVQQYLIK